ncbi:universal stress protein [Ramlibacter tataouinensis]|uniref:universal stress protein n=1 Tax=Ramlibacter tataouinensis TaxID=94132 RepID=UPI0022F401CF|nr:universal stress protein [Ramlibacter tataouinensis]WBY01513.1 universal stress protein [Ramlibacter tataouinensis]
MNIQTVAVLTDLSLREGMAVQRACRIAETHGAQLKLVYMPSGAQAALPNARQRVANAAAQIEESSGLRVNPVVAGGRSIDAIAAEFAGSDLLVLPDRRERTPMALFAGQPAERLLRRLDVPVLVVRSVPADDYGRILVAVNVGPECFEVVAAAAALEPTAELELFHATSTLKEAWLRSAEASEQSVRAYRQATTRHAQQHLLRVSDSFSARRNRVRTTIGRGDPARQALIQQEHTGAALVVVGKRRRAAWFDFLFGSAAQRILGWGRSDVLLVPQDLRGADQPVSAAPGGGAIGPWGGLVGMGGEGGHVR